MEHRDDEMKKENQNQTITIKKADYADIDAIMRVMESAKCSVAQSWFVSDDRDYVDDHIDRNGFVIVAEDRKNGVVGFAMIDSPGMDARNLGTYLGLEGEALLQVAHVDSVAVLPEYRGLHLQERMIRAAEEQLDQMPQYRCRLCTVHPDNVYSRRNLERCGYQFLTTAQKYGGLPRCILYKQSGMERQLASADGNRQILVR